MCRVPVEMIEAWNQLCALTNTDGGYAATVPRPSSHCGALCVFFETLDVDDADYLFTRSWFRQSKELQVHAVASPPPSPSSFMYHLLLFTTTQLQKKLIDIVLRGEGASVYTRAGDFREHLDGLTLIT
jgi:hypothetical protein